MDGTGKAINDRVGGIEAWRWVGLFRECHEWHWDGGTMNPKSNRKSSMKTGFYTRLCFPEDGGLGDQPNIVIEIFQIIRNEEAKIQADRF